MASVRVIPSDGPQSTNACRAEPHPISPKKREGDASLAASPLCHLKSLSGAES